MSPVLTQKSTAATSDRRQKDIGATRLPQVNLLPSDITDARNLRQLKLLLAGLLVVVLALIGAGTFLAAGSVTSAQERVDAANRETARLQSEQRKYAEVPVVLQRYDETSAALLRVSVGEVLWTPVIAAVAATLPEGVEVRKLVIESWTPANGLPSTGDPSQVGVLARLAFEVASETRPQTADLLDGLEALPGFVDGRVSSIDMVGSGKDATYSSVVSVSLSAGAAAGRFLPKELK